MNVPPGDDDPDTNATTNGDDTDASVEADDADGPAAVEAVPSAATTTSAVTAPPALTEPRSVSTWHSRRCGLLNTHDGTPTNRSRLP